MCQFGDGGVAPMVAMVKGMEHVPSRRGAIQKGTRAMSEAKRSVVILYEHELLGAGIAKYLRVHSGIEATVAPGHDLAAVTSALAFDPTVVIYELGEQLRQVDLTALAPQAVLIDVSTVVTLGPSTPPDVTGLERLLRAVGGPINAIPLPAQIDVIPLAAPVDVIPPPAEVSLPAESCLGGTLAAPAR